MRVTNAIVSGYEIKIYTRKIKIFDPFSEINDDKAIAIVQYLFDEGFVKENSDINCEIICE